MLKKLWFDFIHVHIQGIWDETWNVDIGFSLISMIKYFKSVFFFQIFTFYPVWFLWTEHGIQGRVLPTTSHDPTLLGGVPRADHSAQKEVLM